MAEVHTTDASNNANGTHPQAPGAGQPVTQQKDASGQIIKTSATVAGV